MGLTLPCDPIILPTFQQRPRAVDGDLLRISAMNKLALWFRIHMPCHRLRPRLPVSQ